MRPLTPVGAPRQALHIPPTLPLRGLPVPFSRNAARVPSAARAARGCNPPV